MVCNVLYIKYTSVKLGKRKVYGSLIHSSQKLEAAMQTSIMSEWINIGIFIQMGYNSAISENKLLICKQHG